MHFMLNVNNKLPCPILDLQPISRELLDNVARPPRLMPTIDLIKYSFVSHHQHGRRASQEFQNHVRHFEAGTWIL